MRPVTSIHKRARSYWRENYFEIKHQAGTGRAQEADKDANSLKNINEISPSTRRARRRAYF